ncbi:response regulator transcription factor [Plebeiibacterium marinum]|uniref:Response regulator transcription factor n=1 Tax=Plebeiibacterium marinum TaxID=2992111 RepID=A0AAE3MFK2_9BACT|nr:response regulator transcription factor [Plebeiobacterium marinum]MCW3806609.1 response regulator transcription factor [Plebeiobacterium marinum]
MTGLNIFIVDDHTLFREGLKFLLSNSSFVLSISEAKNGKDFINNIHSSPPDVVLMDIEMPVKNGIEATKEALKIFPSLKIIALSMYGEENFYRDMIDAGAKGFLLKNSRFDEVEQAIMDVYEGKNYFSPEILNQIIKNLNRNNNLAKKNAVLSKREQEVLFHICKGLSNQEIADTLCISKRTVDKHRENILLKSQSKNTAELVVYAIKYQYFEL